MESCLSESRRFREDGDCRRRRGSLGEDLAIPAGDSFDFNYNILSAAYVTYTVYISNFTYCRGVLKVATAFYGDLYIRHAVL